MTWSIITCLPQAGSFLYLTTIRTGVMIVAYSSMVIEVIYVGQVLFTILLIENMLEGSEFTANMFENGSIQGFALTFAEAIIIGALSVLLLIAVMKTSMPKVLWWLKIMIIYFILSVTLTVILLLFNFVVSHHGPMFQPVFFAATRSMKDFYFLVIVKSYYIEERRSADLDAVSPERADSPQSANSPKPASPQPPEPKRSRSSQPANPPQPPEHKRSRSSSESRHLRYHGFFVRGRIDRLNDRP